MSTEAWNSGTVSVDAALRGGAICASGSAAVDYVTGFHCPIYAVTGCLCAFCGATRSVVALVERHPETALRDNGLIMLILVFVVIRGLLRATGGRAVVAAVDDWIQQIDMRTWTGLLLTWTVLRNLPWFWYLGPAR